jgi:hypothetical protein
MEPSFTDTMHIIGTASSIAMGGVEENLTPWAGGFERINAYAFFAWLIVLAVTVMRRSLGQVTLRAVPAKCPDQPEPVGQLSQQRRAGMPDQVDTVGGDVEAGRRVGGLHPQGALLEPGLRPSDSRMLPAQRAPCVIRASATRDEIRG